MEVICPVCNHRCKDLLIHFEGLKRKNSDRSPAHEKYKQECFTIIDSLLSEMYIFEIVDYIKRAHPKYEPLINKRFLTNRRKELKINGRKVVGKKRLGNGNPAKDKNVRKKISNTVKQQWEDGAYDNRVNGMAGKFRDLAPNWVEEMHTPLYLAEHEYKEFLAQFQDITICARCGKKKKINIHHIDENHDNFLPSNLEPLCVPCHTSYHYKLQRLPFITIGKTFSFAGAHFLPEHKGLCQHLHGHEWKIKVEVCKRINTKTGMVLDFGDLKSIVNENIILQLDHSLLNDTIPNPTAENLLVWVWERLMFFGLLKGIKAITIWETEDSSATLDVDGMLSIFKNNIEDYIYVTIKDEIKKRRGKMKFKRNRVVTN